MPFTQAFIAAMKTGYTRTELAATPYGEVVYDLAAMNEDDGDERQDLVTMATQDDIRNMLG